MYGMQKAKPTSTTGDQLGQSEGPRNKSNKTLASARHKLYRTAVGQLLWATPVRPDISFAVKELSRSLQAPTRQDEQQLKQVLRYLKGTLHFTTSLQPPRKRVIEKASSIQIQAYFRLSLGKKPSSPRSQQVELACLCGACLFSNFQQHTSFTSFIFSRSRALCNGDGYSRCPLPKELTARDAAFTAS